MAPSVGDFRSNCTDFVTEMGSTTSYGPEGVTPWSVDDGVRRMSLDASRETMRGTAASNLECRDVVGWLANTAQPLTDTMVARHQF
jgi:hypothetical protein